MGKVSMYINRHMYFSTSHLFFELILQSSLSAVTYILISVSCQCQLFPAVQVCKNVDCQATVHCFQPLG